MTSTFEGYAERLEARRLAQVGAAAPEAVAAAIGELDAAVAGVEGHGFEPTPFGPWPELAEADARRESQVLKNFLHEADASETIYLADRYFLDPGKDPKSTQHLYADVQGASLGLERWVLCTEPPNAHPNPWWSRFPTHMTTHLKVRSVYNNGRPAFHDRYLITPQRETLLTNSLNGWAIYGVTFATLPYGVYRAEAMHLWSLTPNAHTPPYDVEEYP